MELLQKALCRELAEEKPRPLGPETIMIIDRHPDVSWRRLSLRVLLLSRVAWHQAVLMEVSNMVPYRFRMNENREVQSPGSSSNQRGKTIAKMQLLLRKQLSKSQSPKVTGEPSLCHHEDIIARGGGGKKLWWTCRQCGTRWPREDKEVLSR